MNNADIGTMSLHRICDEHDGGAPSSVTAGKMHGHRDDVPPLNM